MMIAVVYLQELRVRKGYCQINPFLNTIPVDAPFEPLITLIFMMTMINISHISVIRTIMIISGSDSCPRCLNYDSRVIIMINMIQSFKSCKSGFIS